MAAFLPAMKLFLRFLPLVALVFNLAALPFRPAAAATSLAPEISTATAISPAASATHAASASTVSPLLAAFDADRDGKLSASEIDRAAAVLRFLDANRDGTLTADEFPVATK
jgi:hypothetical protein